MYLEQGHDFDKPIVEEKEEVRRRISDHRRWYLSQALVFILLGILALVMPYTTAIALNLILGGHINHCRIVSTVCGNKKKPQTCPRFIRAIIPDYWRVVIKLSA